MSDPIRIVVVDDHNLVRAGFKMLLEHIEDFDVVGEASNGVDALEVVEELKPNIVVTDIAMDQMTGIELTGELHKRELDVRCIVLSMHKTTPYVKSALAAGACGYLLKEAADAELEIAIRAVFRGETYLSPAVAGLLLNGANDKPVLTKRQTEVLTAIAEGLTTKETALRLGVSPKTVETHRAELMKRLDIYDVAGLVRYALREGYVELD